MASGKLMDEINEQFLLCKICFEILKKPKTLVCMHTFCMECIDKHMNAEQERTSYRYSIYTRTVSCPICRRKTDLPTGGVRKLPDNFLLSSLTDVILSKTSSSGGPLCEICIPAGDNNNGRKHGMAVSKCLDCNKLLCENCVERHKKTKVTQNHDLYDMNAEKDVVCKEHDEETVRYYCEPCQMCICVVCTFQAHKDHEVSSFTEGINKNKMTLENLVERSRDKLQNLKGKLDMIMNCENNMKDAEGQIHDLSTAFNAVIRTREQQLVEEVKEIFGTETLEYLNNKSDLQDVLENLEKTTNLTEMMINDKGIELILLHREIEEKLKQLLEKEFMEVPENLNRRVRFMHGTLNFGDLAVGSGGDDVNTPDDWDVYEHLRQLQFTKEVQTEMATTSDATTTMNCDLITGLTEKNIQVRLYRTVDSETNTDARKCENRSNMTEPPSVKNASIETDAMETGTAITQTEKRRTADVEVACKPHQQTIDTQTKVQPCVHRDTHTMTDKVETKEKHTFTFISTIDFGTNPDMSQTPKTEMVEKGTLVDLLLFRKNASTSMDEIQTRNIGVSVRCEQATVETTMTSIMDSRDAGFMTDGVECRDAATSTKTVVTDSQGTTTDAQEVIDIGTATDHSSASVDIGIMSQPEVRHIHTGTNATEVNSVETMTHMTTRDFGTATKLVTYADHETATIPSKTSDQACETIQSGLQDTVENETNTDYLQTLNASVETESEPVVRTSDIGVTVKCETVDQEAGTSTLNTSECGTSMPKIQSSSVGLETDRVSATNSGNDPIPQHTSHQSTETIVVETADSETFMPPVLYSHVATETYLTMTDSGCDPLFTKTNTNMTETSSVKTVESATSMAAISYDDVAVATDPPYTIDVSIETTKNETQTQCTSTDYATLQNAHTEMDPIVMCHRIVYASPDVLNAATHVEMPTRVDNSTSMTTVTTADVAISTNENVVVKDKTDVFDIAIATEKIGVADTSTETTCNVVMTDSATSTPAPPIVSKSEMGTSTSIMNDVSASIRASTEDVFRLMVDKQTMTPRTISLKRLTAFINAPDRAARTKSTMTTQKSLSHAETNTEEPLPGDKSEPVSTTHETLASKGATTLTTGNVTENSSSSQTPQTVVMKSKVTADAAGTTSAKSISVNQTRASHINCVSQSASNIKKPHKDTKCSQTCNVDIRDQNTCTIAITTRNSATLTDESIKTDRSTSTPTFVRLQTRKECLKTVIMKINKGTSTSFSETTPVLTSTGSGSNSVLLFDKSVGTDFMEFAKPDTKIEDCINQLKVVNEKLHAMPSAAQTSGLVPIADFSDGVPKAGPQSNQQFLAKPKPFKPLPCEQNEPRRNEQKEKSHNIAWRKIIFKPPIKQVDARPESFKVVTESVVSLTPENIIADAGLQNEPTNRVPGGENSRPSSITGGLHKFQNADTGFDTNRGKRKSPRYAGPGKDFQNLASEMPESPTSNDKGLALSDALVHSRVNEDMSANSNHVSKVDDTETSSLDGVFSRPTHFNEPLNKTCAAFSTNDLLLAPVVRAKAIDGEMDILCVPSPVPELSKSVFHGSKESLNDGERVTKNSPLSPLRSPHAPKPPKRGMDSHIKTFEYIQNKAIDNLISPTANVKPLLYLSDQDKSNFKSKESDISSVPSPVVSPRPANEEKRTLNRPKSPVPPKRGQSSHVRTQELKEAQVLEELLGKRRSFNMKAEVMESKVIMTRQMSPNDVATFDFKAKQANSAYSTAQERFDVRNIRQYNDREADGVQQSLHTVGSAICNPNSDVWTEFEDTYRNLEASTPSTPSPTMVFLENKPFTREKKQKTNKPPALSVRGRSLHADMEKMRNLHGRTVALSSREKDNKARQQVLDMTQLLASPVMGSFALRDNVQHDRQRHQSIGEKRAGQRNGREISPSTARVRSKSAERPPKYDKNNRLASENPHVIRRDVSDLVDPTVSLEHLRQHNQRMIQQKRDLMTRAVSVEEQVEDVLHELDDIILRSKTRRSLSETSYALQQHPLTRDNWVFESDGDPPQTQNSPRPLPQGPSNSQSTHAMRPEHQALAQHCLEYKGASPPRVGAGEVYIDSNYQQVDLKTFPVSPGKDELDLSAASPRRSKEFLQELQTVISRPRKEGTVYLSRAELKKMGRHNLGKSVDNRNADFFSSNDGGISEDFKIIEQHSTEAPITNRQTAFQKTTHYFKF